MDLIIFCGVEHVVRSKTGWLCGNVICKRREL